MATCRHRARLRGHTNQIYGLAISPAGQTVATGSGTDGVTRVWRTDRSEAGHVLNLGSLIAGFTTNSRTLVLGPRPGDYRWHLIGKTTTTVAVATHDAGSAKPLAELKGHVMGVLRASFFPDGKTLATGSLDGRVKLWNLASHQ